MLISKKTASSLPSLLDPKHYNDAASPRRHPKEAPDTLRGSQGQHGDHYDSLAQRKTFDHAYYNQKTTASTGSLALLIEDDEPDCDEVDEEEEEEDLGSTSVPCMRAIYKDISGMEDFIDV